MRYRYVAIALCSALLTLQSPLLAEESAAASGAGAGAGAAESIWDKTKGVSREVWESSRDGAAAAVEYGGDKAAAVWDTTRDGASDAVDLGADKAGDAVDATLEGAGSLWDKVKTKARELVE